MRRIILLCALACPLALSAQDYKNSSLTPERRAADLLSRLTLEEKVSLMQNNSPGIERLDIKPYEWWNEALHGVARSGLATVFPQAIGMAASWDDDLLFRCFTAVSDEARVKNRLARAQGSYKRYQGLTFWTPNVNIFRDPRWGRGQETYGEDPYLSSRMGQAVVRGLQGPEGGMYDKVHACAKHFAVHSGPEWNRHTFNVEHIDPRELHETYLYAFKDLVQRAGVKEVMCAYNRLDGDPCCGSDKLLTHILRSEWGFKGLVVTDCGAIDDFYQKGKHETHADREDASAAAVLSGTDLECGESFHGLVQAVREGGIREEDIDRSVLRLLTARFQLGEMDETTPWDALPDSLPGCTAHRNLSLQMARESMVLLRNRDNLLPLNDAQTIAVVGPNANDSVMQWGNYNGFPSHTVTLLEEMRRRLPASHLIYVPACDRTSATIFRSLFDRCHTDKGNGFAAAYWDNARFEGEPVVRTRHTTPFQFSTEGGTAFAAGVPVTNFAGSYTTTFYPEHDGEVKFFMQMIGAYELRVDGKSVAKKIGWLPGREQIHKMTVKQGEHYDIELRYNYLAYMGQLIFDMGEHLVQPVDKVLELVRPADVVVFAGGIAPSLEGEEMMVDAEGFRGGDRTDIQLPKVQREIVAALQGAGKRIVFVNYSGSAMGLVPEAEHCDAILQAWYPGQGGGRAVADVLFGNYNPGGKLPVTFYKDTTQLSGFEDYSMKGRTYRYMRRQPLFCFGHGLSYTTFEYGKARLKKDRLLIPVKNTGERDGDEVVQVYVQRPSDTEGPVKTLRAFERVHLKAGEQKMVSIPIDGDTFAWWDASTNTVRPLPGAYRLLYGGSSDDRFLKSVEMQY